MKTLAIANQKGGVGKSTLTVHLAYAATEAGLRVLLVDTLHEKAARFYRAYGFREAMANSHTLYLPLGNP